jgi:hypothetical protein
MLIFFQQVFRTTLLASLQLVVWFALVLNHSNFVTFGWSMDIIWNGYLIAGCRIQTLQKVERV